MHLLTSFFKRRKGGDGDSVHWIQMEQGVWQPETVLSLGPFMLCKSIPSWTLKEISWQFRSGSWWSHWVLCSYWHSCYFLSCAVLQLDSQLFQGLIWNVCSPLLYMESSGIIFTHERLLSEELEFSYFANLKKSQYNGKEHSKTISGT